VNNFKDILDEAILDSDVARKLQGRLSKSATALRLSRIAIGSVMRNIDDYKKGKMDAEDFSKIISAYIAKAEKK